MKCRLGVWSVLLPTLLLVGCATLSPKDPTDEPPRRPKPQEPNPRSIRKDSCMKWRWVGLTDPGRNTCPIPPLSHKWKVQAVLSDGSLSLNQNPDYFPPHGDPSLARLHKTSSHPQPEPFQSPEGGLFCLYQTPYKTNFLTLLPLRLLDWLGVLELEKDCAAVSPLATSFPTVIYPGLQEQFDHAVKSLKTAASCIPKGNLTPENQPTISVIDTQKAKSWKRPSRPASAHGWSMAHIIRHLTCGERAFSKRHCLADIRTWAALTFSADGQNSFDPEIANGNLEIQEDSGNFGAFSELALSILAEVNMEQGSPETKNQVVNLSIGWDGNTFGGLEDRVGDMHPKIQQVYLALETAACRGALIFAAHGSLMPGLQDRQVRFLPAAWADRTLDPARCKELGVLVPSWLKTGEHPLLYAVGGVDRLGRPLVTTPKTEEDNLSSLELFVYADHVAVGTPSNGNSCQELKPLTYTKTYTGSSVAAAVASASAALVWAIDPELSPKEVVERLKSSGWPLGLDDQTGNPAPGKRIVICPTIQDACKKQGSGHPVCNLAQECRELDLASLGLPPDEVPQTVEIIPCPGTASQTTGVSGTCPATSYPPLDIYPALGPQPQDPPCPNCTSDPDSGQQSSYVFYAQIDDDWPEDLQMQEAILHIGDDHVHLKFSNDLKQEIQNGASFSIAELTSQDGALGWPMVLELIVGKTGSTELRSVESPVYRAP